MSTFQQFWHISGILVSCYVEKKFAEKLRIRCEGPQLTRFLRFFTIRGSLARSSQISYLTGTVRFGIEGGVSWANHYAEGDVGCC